jgi:anaerobic dimethyl sulfoxide reductase subunit B (iron-sulfur subunit)
MTYAFTFDASACTGCKACQVACKDRHNLPVGVFWRRVVEVTGGTWTNIGAGFPRPELVDEEARAREPRPYDVWENTVFAYNLSIACNHCVHPKCAGVCPTEAIRVRDDGIVYIDTERCMGCGYCAWACPYGVPQYNPKLGRMTKCNFCMDDLDAGLPPACVAACPLRVLDFVEIREERVEIGEKRAENSDQVSVTGYQLWSLPASEHPFPLPQYSRTEPHLAIQPHAGMLNALEKTVSNREEIRAVKSKSELPLVAFTLLSQMAAGMAVLSFFTGPLTAPVLVAIGSLIGAGGLVSLLHLGAPMNAWRALAHLNKSWLSREVLVFGLFGASWLAALAMPGMGKLPLALCGVGLVYSMAQVYGLRSLPAWDTGRTLLAFVVSAVLLGGLGLAVVDALVNGTPRVGYLLAAGAGGGGVLLLSLSEREQAHRAARRFRLGLIGLLLLGLVTMCFAPDPVGRWLALPILILALGEEALGRWLFYEHLHRRVL